MKIENKYLVLHKFFQMNKRLFFLVVVIPIIFSSCATIFGGRKYNAIVKTNRPNAEIIVNNQFVGKGFGIVSVERKDANKLNILIKEKGCEDTIFNFRSRKIRGFALAGAIAPWVLFTGSILTLVKPSSNTSNNVEAEINPASFLGLIVSIPLIYTSSTDFVNFGTMYKPDTNELGVYKIDYDNYEYRLNSSCIAKPSSFKNQSNLKSTVYLKNGSVIRGNIIELKPNISIKIQTSNGSIFVISFDEIEKFTQEKM